MFLMSDDAGLLCKPHVRSSEGSALVVQKYLNVLKLLLDQVEAAIQMPADDGRKTRDVLFSSKLSCHLMCYSRAQNLESPVGANPMLRVVDGKEGRGV